MMNQVLIISILLVALSASVRAQDYESSSYQTAQQPLLPRLKLWWQKVSAPKAAYVPQPYTSGKQGYASPDPNATSIPDPIYDWRERVMKFSKELDRLNAQAEEWGTIQMAPFLMAPVHYSADSNIKYPFALDTQTLTSPTQNQQATSKLGLEGLFNEYNNIEGSSAAIERTQFRAAGDLSAMSNVTPVGGSPAPNASNLSASALFNTANGAAQITTGVSAATNTTAKDLIIREYDSTKPTGAFSPHSRLIQAAGTNFVKNVLILMGKPDAVEKFKDLNLIYAVSTISVNPGWRSKKDFTAHLDVYPTIGYDEVGPELISRLLHSKRYPVEFRKKIAESYVSYLSKEDKAFFDTISASKLNIDLQVEPTVFEKGEPQAPADQGPRDEAIQMAVVSPLMDTQGLDLASSNARQDQVALQLAATMSQFGLKGASLFSDWAHARRADVATRSTLAVANSYSFGGGIFGFEVGPRLRGLEDPEAKKAKAGMVLERQSFPILVMMGMHETDAEPKFTQDPDGSIRVWMPALRTRYNTRWNRHTRSSWGVVRWFETTRPLSESYASRHELERAKQVLSGFDRHIDSASVDAADSEKRSLLADYEVLTSSLFGSNFETALPASYLVSDEEWVPLGPPLEEQVITANKLSIFPTGDIELHSNETDPTKASAPMQVLIQGPNLKYVDLTAIQMAVGEGEIVPAKTSNGTSKAEMARLIGNDTLAISVTIKPMPGAGSQPVSPGVYPPTSLQFLLPIQSGAPALPNMTTSAVLSPVCTYHFKLAVGPDPKRTPVIAALLKTDFLAVGVEDKNKDLVGNLDVVITGENLDLLDPKQAGSSPPKVRVFVKPDGYGTGEAGSIQITGKTSAFITVKVKGNEHSAYLQFVGTDNAVLAYSPPFNFKLQKAQ